MTFQWTPGTKGLKRALSNNDNYNDFNDELKKTFNNHAPLKTIIIRGNKNPQTNKT